MTLALLCQFTAQHDWHYKASVIKVGLLLFKYQDDVRSNTHKITYLLTPWCRVLLEKLTDLQLVKKFPAYHGTRKFITALTTVRHLSLSWASPIQSIYPHPTSWRSIIILSTHLRLGLSNWYTGIQVHSYSVIQVYRLCWLLDSIRIELHFILIPLASSQHNLYDIHRCCVCSARLLMMGRGTVRNM